MRLMSLQTCALAKNLGLPQEEVEKRAEEALEQVGFPKEAYKKSPFELSGGQKRRAAIAGILAMHPEVLILDEPTAGLDPKGRDEILDQISKLHRGEKDYRHFSVPQHGRHCQLCGADDCDQ